VNFEHFCGNTKPVERPGSRVQQGFAAKRREKTQKMKCVVVLLRATQRENRVLEDFSKSEF
jgi:hypothetical protein